MGLRSLEIFLGFIFFYFKPVGRRVRGVADSELRNLYLFYIFISLHGKILKTLCYITTFSSLRIFAQRFVVCVVLLFTGAFTCNCCGRAISVHNLFFSPPFSSSLFSSSHFSCSSPRNRSGRRAIGV